MSKNDLDSAMTTQNPSGARVRKRSALMLSAAMLALSAAPAWAEPSPPTALPTGGTVAAGSATLSTSGADLTVNQSSNRVVIDWRSFNIGSAAGVTFNQPSSTSIAVNRVSGGGAPSQIDGRLTANGIVAILNPNGVLFGGNARVDVGGLVASTGQIDANAFMGGNDRLAFTGATDGEIVVQAGARLNVADAGLAAFVAPRVRNDGVITARGGRIALGAGETFTLDLAGDRLLELGVAADSPLVQNHGQLLAAGGQVQLSARAAGALVDQIINVGGLVSVASAHSDGGTIVLDGVGGSATIGGTLDASGTSGGTIKAVSDSLAVAGNGVLRANATGTGNGGFIETSGTKSITVADGVSVSAASAGGKAGTWLIDPTNITITSGSGGGLGGSTVTTGAVEAALGGGTNVTITTDLAGTEDGDLTVAGSINATSSGNAGLTLTGRRISRTGGSTVNIAGGALTLNVNAVNPVTSTAGLGNWIQDALDTIGTVSGGSTVNVGAGTYVGNVLISRSNVSLVASAGRDATTIQGVSGTGALGAVQIGAGANNTLVEGFTILGIDSPSPGIENAAVYFQGTNSGSTIRNNRITAMGDAGLQNEFGLVVTNLTVTGNIFDGKTYAGATPATGNQFTVPNVSRQLVVLSGGSGGGNTSNITFTNNQVTGDSGFNTAVTIDSVGATITGNTFASLTGSFGAGLRARGTNTLISGNTFDNSRLAIGTSPITVRNTIYGAGQANFAAVLAANTITGGGAWSSTTFNSMDTLFRSVQNAVLTSSAGATVTVLPGTYAENVLISVPNLTLVSTGGRDVTTIQGVSGGSSLGAVQIAANANNTIVDGFTIIGIDNGNPGIENAAVYFQGANSGSTIRNNRVTAAGDAGLQNEFGQTVSNLTVTGNIFDGKTYVGAAPATGNQFTVPNVSRQLVVLSGGSGGGATSGITFTNNQVTGDSGLNTAVTIDSVGATITGNSFASLTGGFGAGLRARGTNTLISGNTFDNSRLAVGTSPITVRTSIYGTMQANFAALLAANTITGGGAWSTTALNSMDTLFRSIQNAVLTSTSGATVTVLPGTYDENILITLPNISLVFGNVTVNGLTLTSDATGSSIQGQLTAATSGISAVGALLLSGDTSLTATGSNVSLASVDGAAALTLTGDTVTIGSAGATTALTSLAATGGTIVTAGAVTTGAQSFAGATTLAGAYTGGGNISVTGASTLGGTTTVTSTRGTVTLGTVNGAQALALTGTGVTIGAVGGTTALTSLAATGGTIVTAGAVTTGAQNFTGATTLAGAYTGGGNISVTGASTLGAATNVTSTGGTVTLGTVNGAQTLALTGTGVTIGAAGGTTALTSLAATGGTIVTAGAVTTGAQNFTGATTLAGSYTTNGGFTVTGAGTLGGATIVTTNGGALTLASVVGPSALTLTAGTGNVTLGVADVASITAQGAAITTAGGTTTGAQSYTGATTLAGAYTSGSTFAVTGATTLGGATTVSNTSGNVVLGAVNGAQTLAVNSTGTATIGAVGATQALAALTVSGTSISTTGAVTSGAQSYTGPVSLSGTYTTGGGFTATGAATLTGATTINAGTGTASLAAINGTTAGAQGLTLTAGTISLGAAGALIRLGGVLVTANQVVLNGNAYAGNTIAFLASGANATVRVTQPITTFSTVQTGPAGNIQITPTLIGTANNAQNLVFNAGTGLSAANDGDITLGNIGSAALRLGSLTVTGRNFTAQTVRLGGDFVSGLSGNQLFSAQTLDTLGTVNARVAGNDTGPIIAGGAVTITSGGGGGGSVQAGGPVALSYANNVTRAVTSTGPVSVTSTAGSISGPISSGGAVTLATPQGGVSSAITAGGTVGISSSGPVTSTVTTPSTITISSSQPVNVQLNGGTVTVNAPGGTVSGVFGQIVTTSTGTFLVNEQPVLGSGMAEARQIIRDSFLVPAGGTVGSSGEIQLPVGLAIALIAPAGEGKGKRPSIIVNNVNGLGELLRLGYTAIIIDIDQSGLAIEQELTGDDGKTTN